MDSHIHPERSPSCQDQLSIPLNGFHGVRPRVPSAASTALSIPLNGFGVGVVERVRLVPDFQFH